MTRQRCRTNRRHAVARGPDVSLRSESGHSPENHSGIEVVLETTDGPQRQQPLRPVDNATAKEPAEKEKFRRNHSQGASGQNPTQNHGQRARGEKNEINQHGYEDSVNNIEASMRR